MTVRCRLLKNITFIGIVVALLAACATTKITGFTDPDARGTRYSNYVVVTPGLNINYANVLQTKVCGAIVAKGARCTAGLLAFPPTRKFNDEDLAREIKRQSFDAYFVVAFGGSKNDSQHFGSISNSSASIYGNTAYAYGSTTPIVSFSRRDGYSLTLVDVSMGANAWVGGAQTSAQGLANITDEVFTNSLASEIANELVRAGHL